jgi:glycosyltransferase involved in cell wall biosynthesis
MRIDKKVSIVLPIFNGANFVQEAIANCLGQTHQDVELVIVDDGSTDGTLELISAARDSRIVVRSHTSNQGLPSALNTGFRAVSGDFLTWTSVDNYFAPNAIERMVGFLQATGAAFVYCNFFRFNDSNTSQMKPIRPPGRLDLTKTNRVGSCFLYRRAVLDAIGEYDTSVIYAEDYDYWLRVAKTFGMVHLDEFLYYYREHAGSMSSNRPLVTLATQFVRMKHGMTSWRKASSIVARQVVEPLWAQRHKQIIGSPAFDLPAGILSRARSSPFKRQIGLVMKELSQEEIDVSTARREILELCGIR